MTVTMDLRQQAQGALSTVIDPELDEPITKLGFVRSLDIDGGDVSVHLRLPTSFCAPNFAYLMASDAKDALRELPWTDVVVVVLDDHHDSDVINSGLAADAGYQGTFGNEAQDSLVELRVTFQRKAHTAAMERALTRLLRADPRRTERDLHGVTLGELPDEPATDALLRRRATLGLGLRPDLPVFVNHDGTPFSQDEVPMRLRMARSTRISMEGNAHFCRGLLHTRYPDMDDQEHAS